MNYTIPTHRRGDTWDGISSLTLGISATSLNLTGATIKMQLREYPNAPVVLVFSTEDNTIEIINPTAGTIRIPKKVIDINPSDYMYDIEAVLSNGDVKTTVEGKWKIIPDITY